MEQANEDSEVNIYNYMQNFCQFLETINNKKFQAILIYTEEDTNEIELTLDDTITDYAMTVINNCLQAVPGVEGTRVIHELRRIYISYNPEVSAPTSSIVVIEPTVNGIFKAMILAQGKTGRESHLHQQKKDTKYLQHFAWTLSLAIFLYTVNLVFMYVPVFKNWLDIRVLNKLSRGEILRWVVSTPVQFITIWQFYAAIWNGFSNIDMDALVALKANIIYLCSVYLVLRAAFSSEFQAMDFFGSSLMFLVLSLLGRYAAAEALVRRKQVQIINKTITLLTLDHQGNVISKHEIDGGLVQNNDCIGIILSAEFGSDVFSKWEKSHVNENRVLHIKRRRVGSVTVISKLCHLLESDKMATSPSQELADILSKIFMFLGIPLSLLVWLAWFLLGKFNFYPQSLLPHSMDRSQLAAQVWISAMSISSSCSLPLATLIISLVATQVGTSFGVLFKSDRALYAAHKVDCIVFNKRALTTGNPLVDEIKLLKNMELDEFFRLVAAVEANSRHPLAKAILEYAKKKREDAENPVCPDSLEAHDFVTIAGRGVKASVQSKEILVGNRSLMVEHKIAIPVAAEEILAGIEMKAQTGILVAINREIAGVVAISDPLNPVARQVISILKSMKIKCVMVTGDNLGTTNSIARKVGIETVKAEARPEQKVMEVKNLQNQHFVVAMVDCGTSNSDAILTANVGIAIGAGTGIAKEAAHILLSNNNLEDVITAIDLSKKTSFRNGMNCFCASVHNVIGVPIASAAPFLLGFPLQPWIAGAIATASSLVLVVWSYLLKNYTRPKQLHSLEIQEIRVE